MLPARQGFPGPREPRPAARAPLPGSWLQAPGSCQGTRVAPRSFCFIAPRKQRHILHADCSGHGRQAHGFRKTARPLARGATLSCQGHSTPRRGQSAAFAFSFCFCFLALKGLENPRATGRRKSPASGWSHWVSLACQGEERAETHALEGSATPRAAAEAGGCCQQSPRPGRLGPTT